MSVKALTDSDKMPFGKYKDDRMEDVPASYLHWLWANGLKDQDTAVAGYIRENMSVLMDEYPDGIWD